MISLCSLMFSPYGLRYELNETIINADGQLTHTARPPIVIIDEPNACSFTTHLGRPCYSAVRYTSRIIEHLDWHTDKPIHEPIRYPLSTSHISGTISTQYGQFATVSINLQQVLVNVSGTIAVNGVFGTIIADKSDTRIYLHSTTSVDGAKPVGEQLPQAWLMPSGITSSARTFGCNDLLGYASDNGDIYIYDTRMSAGRATHQISATRKRSGTYDITRSAFVTDTLISTATRSLCNNNLLTLHVQCIDLRNADMYSVYEGEGDMNGNTRAL